MWCSLRVGVTGSLLIVLWLLLTVRYNYAGNVTGIFCTGERPTPPWILAENPFIFRGTIGFDGQFYHAIAHDPFLQRQTAGYLDIPRLRYGRILMPLLAFTLAFGHDPWIDVACVVVLVAFVFLGCAATAMFAIDFHRSSWWGLAFLALPVTVISVDRWVADMPLAACCIGFVVAHQRRKDRTMLLLASAAPLIRDTGVVLTLAYILATRFHKPSRWLVYAVLATLPVVAWSLFVSSQAPAASIDVKFVWFATFKETYIHEYSLRAPWGVIANGLDLLAVTGAWLAILNSILVIRIFSGALLAILLFSSTILLILLNMPEWDHSYDLGRLSGPTAALLLAGFLQSGRWWLLVPILFILPRVLLEVGWQIKGIYLGLTC